MDDKLLEVFYHIRMRLLPFDDHQAAVMRTQCEAGNMTRVEREAVALALLKAKAIYGWDPTYQGPRFNLSEEPWVDAFMLMAPFTATASLRRRLLNRNDCGAKAECGIIDEYWQEYGDD